MNYCGGQETSKSNTIDISGSTKRTLLKMDAEMRRQNDVFFPWRGYTSNTFCTDRSSRRPPQERERTLSARDGKPHISAECPLTLEEKGRKYSCQIKQSRRSS